MASPVPQQKRLLSPFRRVFSALGVLTALVISAPLGQAKDHWTELNVGPYFVDTAGDTASARDALAQMEQVRWVLEGLLEIRDLRTVWPIRVVFSHDAPDAPQKFIWKNGQWLLVCAPGTRIDLGEVAGLLIGANTPRLPEGAEEGLKKLLGSVEAHGARVSWGGAVPQPDLAWALMQLFATRFEYRASLHILIASLRNGSRLGVAEQNAFGKPVSELEKEAAENLKAGNWQPISISGRPLDPKHDFGEHEESSTVIDVYLADAELDRNPMQAERFYKAAVEAGGPVKALGFEGMMAVDTLRHGDAHEDMENAISAGSVSAPVYVEAARGATLKPAEAYLKKAAQLNPRWAVPVYEQSRLASTPEEKESLLKKAASLDLRSTDYLVELAELQASDGHAIEAQGTWIRAEDSAPNEAERGKIAQLRMDSEQARLDAADAERTRERDGVRRADQQAQDAEAAQIHAAELKANQELDQAAGSAKPQDAVPWDSTVPKRRLSGTVTAVDCLHTGARIAVRDRAGKSTALYLDDAEAAGFSCGTQTPAKHVSISYAASPDERTRTAGRVLSIQLQ